MNPEVYNKVYASVKDYNGFDLSKFCYIESYASRNPGVLLDAGCGKGHNSRRLIAGGFSVFGIDFSLECEKFISEMPHAISDIISYSRTGAKHSGIICMDVLEHINKQELQETLDALVILAPSCLFGIANHSDVICGEELHVIREDVQWWSGVLENLYSRCVKVCSLYENRFFMLECSV